MERLLFLFIFFIIGFGKFIYAASLPYSECLDLDAASCRLATVTTPSKKLQRKFECFLRDHDFAERSVVCALEDKLPELPRLVLWMDCRQLLKAARNLDRLHFLTETLKEAYENIFYSIEFFIETLCPEDTSRLWSYASGCGYRLSREFFDRLDLHTAKQSDNFSCALVLSTL